MNISQIKSHIFTARADDKTGYYVGGVLIGTALGILIGYSNFIALAVTTILASFLIISRSPLKTLFLFILISPYSTTVYLRDALYSDIPGFKPIQLLAIIIVMLALLNYNKSVKMPKSIFYLISAIFIIFLISIIRSFKHLSIFNEYYNIKDHLSPARYFLTAFLKPVINILPFIIILKFATKKKDLESIMNVIYVTILLFAIHILYLYIFELKYNNDFDEVSSYYSEYFGMHRNEIASYFIIGFPVALGKYFTDKKVRNLIVVAIVVIAIGLVFSRGAYLSTVIAICGYMIISKRTNVIPIIIISLIAVPIILYSPIVKRASHGFQSKDRGEISAGRIDDIWIPLLEEYAKSPKKLVFGDGRYAVMASDSVSEGRILARIRHPHNMYLEIIIDAGLVGFIVFIYFYYSILKKAFQTLHSVKDGVLKEYLYVIVVSIICFLISGITDRSFFPKDDSMFIWVMLACSVLACKIANDKDVKQAKPKLENTL